MMSLSEAEVSDSRMAGRMMDNCTIVLFRMVKAVYVQNMTAPSRK